MDVQRYANGLAQRIYRVLQREGLAGTITGVKQGPHTLTFAVALHEPSHANLRRSLTLAPAIEAAIYDEPVRLELRRGVLMVQAPSPVAVMVDGTRMRGAGLAVPLGVTTLRSVRGVDFAHEPHLLIVAPSGRGKTTAARCLAYHLARQNSPDEVRFIVSTFKPRDWQAFTRLPHTLAVIVTPDESTAMLRWLLGVVHDRARTGVSEPHYFMVLDDLLNLLAVQDVTNELAQIASLGRAAGVHLIIGTQRLGKRGAGDAAVTGNMTTRIVLGTANASDAAQFAGRGKTGAEALGRYPGDALLVQDGASVRLAVGYVSDEQLSTLAPGGAPVGASVPWSSSVCTGAPVHVFAENDVEGAENDDTRTGAPVRPVVAFPLDKRPPTPAEAEAIRAAYVRNGRSLNKTVVEVYGSKGSLTMALLKGALE